MASFDQSDVWPELAAVLRLAGATMAVCCLLYGAAVAAVGRLCVPERAEGSLVRDASGRVVGSRLIAQAFSQPRYVWPRPSAVGYDAASAGGSNLSPAGAALRTRAGEAVKTFGATTSRPLPADLATASGSGLDPHITRAAALYQAGRVAGARGLPAEAVERAVDACAERVNGCFSSDALVNVLILNLRLDGIQAHDER